MTAQAYPLAWPASRKRTPQIEQKIARFGKKQDTNGWKQTKPLTLNEAINRVLEELNRLVAENVVISTNLELRNDGFPRSGQRKPLDCGVCIYSTLDGKALTLPCDTFNTIEGNIAAIAAHIQATRTIERNGVATTFEMFAGFMALPAPTAGQRKKPWYEILQVGETATRGQIQRAYRALSKKAHPDNGGSSEAMHELNEARRESLT